MKDEEVFNWPNVWTEKNDNVPLEIQCSAATEFVNIFVWDYDGYNAIGLEYLKRIFGTYDQISILQARLVFIKDEPVHEQHEMLKSLSRYFGVFGDFESNSRTFILDVIDKVKHNLDGLGFVGEKRFRLYNQFINIATTPIFACSAEVIVESDDGELTLCKGELN